MQENRTSLRNDIYFSDFFVICFYGYYYSTAKLFYHYVEVDYTIDFLSIFKFAIIITFSLSSKWIYSDKCINQNLFIVLMYIN